jgi:hypothetical protein
MSEKLYTARCHFPGHNPWCEVCEEQRFIKKEALYALRRHRDKQIIKQELEELYGNNKEEREKVGESD